MSDVAWSVCLCVGHPGELCRNGWTGQDAVWGLQRTMYYMGWKSDESICRREEWLDNNPAFSTLLWILVIIFICIIIIMLCTCYIRLPHVYQPLDWKPGYRSVHVASSWYAVIWFSCQLAFWRYICHMLLVIISVECLKIHKSVTIYYV